MANPTAGDAGEAAAAGPAVQRQQWYVDERDGFISWLLSEFAAANAIIDSLVHHLRATGNPGEYEAAVACIQQRRFNWNPVIHMQQYFSITEVTFALQQAAWRKQQYQQHQPPQQQRKTGHFGGHHRNFTHHHRLEKTGEAKVSEGLDASSKADCKVKDGENLVGADGGEGGNLGRADLDDTKGICNDVVNQGNEDKISDQDKKHNKTATPKDFVANETSDGSMVNVVEGLKLYEGLLDNSDISRLVSLSNELRTSGRRGELQGNFYGRQSCCQRDL
ncbi:uncharacterized protein M6B38_244345 [Iris pallida]|uniref:Uncharacterized protein n=1 Tax=Iris pallida TaxID=29817 RepID=A0AAX6DHS1_IRIPA|nr:uncharacterized protein M6B38_244345 [Iris pallida]